MIRDNIDALEKAGIGIALSTYDVVGMALLRVTLEKKNPPRQPVNGDERSPPGVRRRLGRA
jgi:hypothetical protein